MVDMEVYPIITAWDQSPHHTLELSELLAVAVAAQATALMVQKYKVH